MIYDWMVELYKSYDWEHASYYEKASHLYCYLGECFDYGLVNSTTGGANDFESANLVARYLGSKTWVCELYAFDASGYAKTNKKNAYYGRFEDVFFHARSYEPEMYEEENELLIKYEDAV